MATSKPHLAAAAGIGALLPFIPDLVKLVPGLPSAVASALCAVILAVAYALVPKQSPAPGGEAGFARLDVLALVISLAAGSLVGCALFRSAAKDPAAAIASAKVDAQNAKAKTAAACKDLRADEAAGLIPAGKVRDDLDLFCALDDAVAK